MTLAELAAVVGAELVGEPLTEVNGVTHDSRRVQTGDLFVAIPGHYTDGHLYLREALRSGASAVAVEDRAAIPQGASGLVIDSSRARLGPIASAVYGNPAAQLRLIGVTGTKGKTTTTYLIRAILAATGRKVGLIGTVAAWIGDHALVGERTTPEASDLHRLFRRMVDEGCQDVVMEVSSHALDLGRVNGLHFSCAVFTNLSHDHLDFHLTMDRYRASKLKLFQDLGREGEEAIAVIHADDPEAHHFVRASKVPVILYGTTDEAQVIAEDAQIRVDGARFRLLTPQGLASVSLRLTGRFNVQNALAAAAVASAFGIDPTVSAQALGRVQGVPGRMERIASNVGFDVYVDYAHTPASLENVLETLRDFVRGRILLVFGCGGDRDRQKRAEMGQIAERLADITFLTSDNPRSEDPEAILDEIQTGFTKPKNPGLRRLVDRRAAIRAAISEARAGDVVLIAGKGHETYQIFRDRTVHFDDREEVRSALNEMETGC